MEKTTKSSEANQSGAISLDIKIEKEIEGSDESIAGDVLRFKKKMLEWPNPVEYVNNMYGCHPDDKDGDYFRTVFGDDDSK